MKNKHCDFITCRSCMTIRHEMSMKSSSEWKKISWNIAPSFAHDDPAHHGADREPVQRCLQSAAPAEAQSILHWLRVSRKENTFEVKGESIIQIETEEVQLRSLWTKNVQRKTDDLSNMMSIDEYHINGIPPLIQWIWSQTMWRTLPQHQDQSRFGQVGCSRRFDDVLKMRSWRDTWMDKKKKLKKSNVWLKLFSKVAGNLTLFQTLVEVKIQKVKILKCC